MAKKKVAPVVISGYKGFDKNMQCRGFQFTVGETYKHDGEAKACQSGFHFCENPLDVFKYYPPAKSLYATVNGGGQLAKHEGDTKVACTELTVNASINLAGIIKAGVAYVIQKVKDGKEPFSSGDSSSAASSGYSSSAAANGLSSPAVCAGLRCKAKAGSYGCIALGWWNPESERQEMRCAEIGCGDGSDGKLKADVWYKLDDNGCFVELD